MLFGALLRADGSHAPAQRGRACIAWVSAGGLAVFVYWFLHASVDWLWEFPRAHRRRARDARAGLRRLPAGGCPRRRSRAPASLVAVGGLLLPTVLAAPWISEIETQRALDGWRGDAEAAFSSLDRAKRLTRSRPGRCWCEGRSSSRARRLPSAEAAFRQVLEKEPDNAYGLLELGAIAGERRSRARGHATAGARACAAPPRRDHGGRAGGAPAGRTRTRFPPSTPVLWNVHVPGFSASREAQTKL